MGAMGGGLNDENRRKMKAVSFKFLPEGEVAGKLED